MNDRRDRGAWLNSFVHAPAHSGANQMALARANRALADPSVGPKLTDAYRRYVTTVIAQQEGGAGLLADEQVRYFQRDYHHRLMELGAQYMPTSYRIAEAFFECRPGAPGFYLMPERDYQFSFSDFLDYITGSDSPRALIELGYGFLEGQIYNLTSTDALGALLLETRGEGAYAVRAANIVRRGDEVVVMLTLGEQLTADRLADISTPHDLLEGLSPIKPGLRDSFSKVVQQPAYILGSPLLSTIALVRFNVRERRMESRCLLRDMSESFRTWTDDLEAFGSGLDSDSPAFQKMVQELDACDAVWEVAKTLTLFPAYLAAKVHWTSERQERTELGKALPASLKKQRSLKDASQQDKVLFRTISAIAVNRTTAPALEGRSYSAPAFQVAVEGFWRALANAGSRGRGPDGAETFGRTWVRSHIRHKDKALPLAQKVVYIKASLSEARARLERFRKHLGKHDELALKPQPLQVELPRDEAFEPSSEEGKAGAFVYIMRCHAHTEDLFKVGFTDRDPEARAKELSSATASPSPFVVLHAWAVSDGHAAEKSAHAALGGVRLSGNREFFQLAYEELRSQVAAAVGRWFLGP